MSKEFIKLPELTLKALFEYSIKEYGDKPAFQFVDGEVTTYKQLAMNVYHVQDMLIEYGIKKGDRVAIYSENMPNWSSVYLAITTMGAVAVPILPDFHTSEALHIANHAECKAAFISQKLFETMLDETQPPNLNLLVILNEFKILEKLSTPSRMDMVMKRGEEQFSKVMKSGEEQFSKVMDKMGMSKKSDAEVIEEDIDKVLIDEKDLAAIIYTSGTTGSSKGVMLSHINLVSNVTNAQHMLDIYPEDKFLSILPLAHTLECTTGMLIPLLNGASVHYIKKTPTPTVLIKALATVKPDLMLSVPLIIEKIYKNKILPNFNKNIFIKTIYAIPFFRKKLNEIAGKKLIETFGGNIRFFGIGGAGVSPTVEKFLREAKFPYAIGYGLTETSPLLAGTNANHTKYKAIGPVIPGTQLQLRDVKDGVGILWAKGPNVMMGYYKDPEKTAEVLDEDGWFNTEDMGYIDEEGYFFMSGRAKNIIVGPSGENIYPEQIEAALNAHPFVSDSLVLDKDGTLTARIYLDYEKLDDILGATKKSETKAREKVQEILEEIRKEVNESVSSFSRIKKVIEQKEEFVRTPTKKIKRYLYL
ncbi:Long-chain-fatty-acid--CoA ligase [hydrothermal vent metagenome]|uniref:Long-chain-fatty-acid--CoA ligase n=1 Tax=hydrothermal vent metagenome TaxID=652676 RepID=A0A1W1ED69_9ZZZZ